MAFESSPRRLGIDVKWYECRRASASVAFLIAMGYAAAVLYWFHDRSWWPPDEGVYAHVADRVLDGEVLSRDVQYLHPGYDVFATAAAFAVWGEDLLSLRYPLVVMSFLTCVVMFLVVARRDVLSAFVATICVASLSVVQFLNPTAHWYCFFLFALIVGCLSWMPPGARWRVQIVGFLATTIALFQQLTGVYVIIGVVAYFLAEAQRGARGRDTWLARGIHLTMTAGMAVYLSKRLDPFAFLAYGIWPLVILIAGLFMASVGNRHALRLVGRLVGGGVVAVLPILVYHLSHGSFGAWLDDNVVAAISLDGLGVESRPRFVRLVRLGLERALSPSTVHDVPNCLFWALLPLTPIVLGAWVTRDVVLRGQAAAGCAPLPFLACFFALVSVRLQIPLYLFFTIAFTLAGLCWMVAERRTIRFALAAVLLMSAAIGVVYHAGQPVMRYDGDEMVGRRILSGERVALVPAELPRATLWIESSDRDLYRWLIGLIDDEVSEDESILALPMNAELYFLSQRRNPWPYYMTAVIPDEAAQDHALKVLRRDPPRIVVFRVGDKYNTEFSRRVVEFVQRRYELIDSRFGFEVYFKPRVR